MRKYLATYQDQRGTEEVVIKSDGSDMYFTLRGIDFEGQDFEMLGAEEIDDSKFDYEMFQDGSGDLTNFTLAVTIPILLFDSIKKNKFTAPLIVHVEVGETTTIKGLDSELTCLMLTTSFGEFTVEKKLEWMEDALIAIQNQLPEHIYLNTCLSCKYSNYHPVGNGMFGGLCCFKNYKAAIRQMNNKYDLMNSWTEERVKNKSLFFVQETFDCQEHQLPTKEDWFYKDWRKTI
ncbi:DUF6304 family protein [uncultured Aquimarina sp.]|uniref:DUF6304 family protein n=1 Tax=uncultured Aquimarina sp. TaxID=575652 RepID=UPI00260EC29A|nr:DUF6304 family protein [uncultured Aquimarina sp.]